MKLGESKIQPGQVTIINSLHVIIHMEEYRVDCPICDAKAREILELQDTSVIYSIEGYESKSSGFWSWRSPDPTAKRGANKLIDRSIYTTDELNCDNGHDLTVRHCHYGEIDDEDIMLYGPSNRPDIRCPRCQYLLGDHSEYVYRVGKGEDMHFILRSVTDSPARAYRHVEAITRTAVGTLNQVSTIEVCPNCGLDVYLNFSNKVYQQNEKYEGYISQY